MRHDERVNRETVTDDATERFRVLAADYLSEPMVTAGTGFGSTAGLKIRGKIFAMLLNGRLVVKLPKPRVEELVAAGAGTNLDTGRGRLMKEWLTVPMASEAEWSQLAGEAYAFVGEAAEPRVVGRPPVETPDVD